MSSKRNKTNRDRDSFEQNNYTSTEKRASKRPYSPSEGTYSDKAIKIMRLMGFREGEGLGKDQDGIKEPIEAHKQKGRRGLGHKSCELNEEPIPPSLEWNISEAVDIQEKFEWIPHPDLDMVMPPINVLRSWKKVDQKKLIIDDETNFVNVDYLKWILRCKSALDQFSEKDLFHARSRSNPYETIRKGIFMNRAAMKMANIDAVMNMEVTNPRTISGEYSVKEKELLYFADICAGPGGFSEYVLWRKGWKAKGFGFTLKGECDFKLWDFISGPPESFEPHYGVNEDGDIFNPENCQSFIGYVLKHTEEKGVHFVMADGGFSVKGQENIQEILSRQLYLSQAMVALGIIREGGHFICKLFDVFTPFSVGLVYLMRFCFEEVALLKPNTSRPANSERYLICKWRKGEIKPVYEYLKECHQEMWFWKSGQEDKDLLEIVPLELLKCEEDPFYSYILEGNNEIGIRQIQNLRKIVAFWADNSLTENRQEDTRRKCLEFWNIPPGFRQRVTPMEPLEKFRLLLEKTHCIASMNFEASVDRELTSKLRATEFRSPYNWRLCVVENGKFKKNRGFFLSTGRSQIFKFDGYSKWDLVDHYIKFQMANDTLVYGEIVTEYEGLMPNQKKISCFHIIDGLILGGKDIRSLSLEERNEWCKTFALSMNKNYEVSNYGSFRAKELVPFEDFRLIQSKLQCRRVSGGGKTERLLSPVSMKHNHEEEANTSFIQPGGIIFLQEIPDPWLVAISKTCGEKYYFDRKTGYKCFERPANAVADFVLSTKNRVYWDWDKDVNLLEHEDENLSYVSGNKVHASEIIEYVNKIQKDGVK